MLTCTRFIPKKLSCIATLYSSAFSSQVNVWMQVAVTDSGVFYYSING